MLECQERGIPFDISDCKSDKPIRKRSVAADSARTPPRVSSH
jgi:hypothetical protein